MMNPTLVILAAGMGSRFGGLKQITSVDQYGHAIIDFSLYDAYRAGFRNVAFIIKHEIEDDFKRFIGNRMEKYFHVDYVYQELSSISDDLAIPEGRQKPWGTGHAVACCAGTVEGPFAVINADDFYGRGAFSSLYDFLSAEHSENEHAMVSYQLKNTVTENGTVSRGICAVENGCLMDVVERTKIQKYGEDGLCLESGEQFIIPGTTPVSMNCWGFSNSILDELNGRFPSWFQDAISSNPLKAEYFLPTVVNECIKLGKCSVRVLNCDETWYGITYREDLPSVTKAISDLRDAGIYPIAMLE